MAGCWESFMRLLMQWQAHNYAHAHLFFLTGLFMSAYTSRMNIKALRKTLGLSQADLASKLGVTQGTISRFENGVQVLDERTKLALEALKIRAAL